MRYIFLIALLIRYFIFTAFAQEFDIKKFNVASDKAFEEIKPFTDMCNAFYALKMYPAFESYNARSPRGEVPASLTGMDKEALIRYAKSQFNLDVVKLSGDRFSLVEAELLKDASNPMNKVIDNVDLKNVMDTDLTDFLRKRYKVTVIVFADIPYREYRHPKFSIQLKNATVREIVDQASQLCQWKTWHAIMIKGGDGSLFGSVMGLNP